MAYQSTYDLINSEGLKKRLVACAASEGIANPIVWVEQQIWAMVPLMITPPDAQNNSQPWWQVWEFAEANKNENVNQDTGARTDVILDSWIQIVVQTHISNLATP